ncbi:ASST-domain-containing protein [Leucosporidium creatinivorum]|uniref:ASST-domain-containing protein n=1 Tax=Leucosporidium creatinivorum TaxID=106004 RepID=A0A1Y2DX12_9BASI|nr:ASST-domain-containing protein [Leucosporidium creatinivorum]
MPALRSAAAAALLLASVAVADEVYYDSSAWLSGSYGSAPVQTFMSSNLTPPAFNIETAPTSASNYSLLSYRGTATTQPAPLIMDSNGSLIWSGSADGYTNTMNTLVQTYKGEPVLTFFTGDFYSGGYGQGAWQMLASNYSVVGTVATLNETTEGDNSDFHEFFITENNTALVESWRVTEADLSGVSGYDSANPATWTWDCVFQEIDIETNTLLFEWRSLEHVDPSETYFEISDGSGNSSSNPFDHCHINSVEKDAKNNYLVSMRGPSTIYYIDGTTSEIIYRISGKNTNFTMGTDATFWYQHDARFRSDNTVSPYNLSIFDNAAGGSGDVETSARGIVLSIDTDAMTAELVWSAAPSFNTTAPSQGSHQILDNGDHVIGWGAVPQFSVYSEAGEPIEDVRFGVNASTVQSYRAFKQDWIGYPLTTPSFALNTSHAFASWNGATEIASWQLLGGSSADSLSSISTNTKDGFEATMSYNSSYTYLAAAAISSDGTCLGVSDVYEVSSLATTGTAGTCPSGTTVAASGSGSSSSTTSTSAAASVRVGGLLGAVFALMLIL